MALQARSDDPFLHVRDNQLVSESRYQPLYATQPAITGSPTQTVQRVHRGANAVRSRSAFYLREQLAALERLKVATDGAARARVRRSHRLLLLPARRLAARPRQLPARADAQPPRRRRRALRRRASTSAPTPGSKSVRPEEQGA